MDNIKNAKEIWKITKKSFKNLPRTLDNRSRGKTARRRRWRSRMWAWTQMARPWWPFKVNFFKFVKVKIKCQSVIKCDYLVVMLEKEWRSGKNEQASNFFFPFRQLAWKKYAPSFSFSPSAQRKILEQILVRTGARFRMQENFCQSTLRNQKRRFFSKSTRARTLKY